jgi:O-antigen/teichoic acid export membrane protein
MGYLKTSIISVSWVSAFRVTYRILSVVRTIILARLLTPTQFGDFGIASLVLALVEIFTETGINVFLVQQEEDDAINTYVNTAWVISIYRGILIAGVVALSSFPVSAFFNNEASKSLILFMALVPLIRGFINPASAKFQKHLKFNKEFYFRSCIALVDAIIALTIALIYKSTFSLIAGLVAGAIAEVIISILWIKPRPKFIYEKDQAKKIIKSGKWITGAGIASYFASKGIDISIGKLSSTNSLGIYQMAYKFSVLFVDEMVEMINRVAFPIYVRIGGDRKRLFAAFLKTYTGFAISVSCMMAFVALFASPIVDVLLGPNWHETTKYLQLLSLVGTLIAIVTPTNPLFLAVKKQNYLTHAVTFQLIAFIGCMIPVLISPNLEKIIWASVISLAASLPLRWYYTFQIFRSNA